jgi:hypothetical protein
MTRIVIKLMCCLAILPLLISCNDVKAFWAREFRQDEVADGVARLFTQPLSMVVSELNNNAEVGFDSKDVEMSIIKSTDPKTPGKGTVIWTITDKYIDHPTEQAIYENCHGSKAYWHGQIYIKKATKSLTGILTGNPKKPVMPDPEGTVITAEIEFHNLAVRFAGMKESLIVKSGKSSFSVKPRLAQSQQGQSKGLRVVTTPNTKFEDIIIKETLVELISPEVRMEVPINDAKLFLQVGLGEDGTENVIKGDITIFGTQRSVPTDNLGLDPNYDRKKFEETYGCHPDLQGEVSFNAVKLEERLAHGIAALSANLLGGVAQALENDQKCGFSSPETLLSTTLSDQEGEIGESRMRVNSACWLNFESYRTPGDAFGFALELSGSIRIDEAHKTLKGRIITSPKILQDDVEAYRKRIAKGEDLTLSPKPESVSPLSRQMATLGFKGEVIDLSFKQVCVGEGETDNIHHCKKKGVLLNKWLTLSRGAVTATFKPIMAKDLEEGPTQGFCAFKTKNASVDIALSDAEATIHDHHSEISVHVDGEIKAYSGIYGAHENELSGYMALNQHKIEFTEGDLPFIALDPNYDPGKFVASYSLGKKIAEVSDDYECSDEEALAPNVARLLVANAATLLRLSSDDKIEGGFSSVESLKNRELKDQERRLILRAQTKAPQVLPLIGPDGGGFWQDPDGSIYVLNGTINSLSGKLSRVGERTHGPVSMWGFNVNVMGNRFVELAEAWWKNNKHIYVNPTTPDSTSIKLKAEVNQFSAVKYRDHQRSPYLLIDHGEFSLRATPFMGRDARLLPGRNIYSIPTPIVEFDKVAVKNSYVRLRTFGVDLPIVIVDAKLQAKNGFVYGNGNYVSGHITYAIGSPAKVNKALAPREKTIVINKQPLMVAAPSPYNQKAFDDSYKKTPNLAEVLPAN